MPWIKVATCPVCGKRLKLKKENRLGVHKWRTTYAGGGVNLRCSGSNNSGKEVRWELKPKPA
jgi:phage/plasmid primase-like uncharacterized protein